LRHIRAAAQAQFNAFDCIANFTAISGGSSRHIKLAANCHNCGACAIGQLIDQANCFSFSGLKPIGGNIGCAHRSRAIDNYNEILPTNPNGWTERSGQCKRQKQGNEQLQPEQPIMAEALASTSRTN